MILHFGLTFDDSYTPIPASTEGGIYYAGPKALLRILEYDFGLPVLNENREHLRTEWYRQALLRFLQHQPHAFFADSFRVDPLNTASQLLTTRDELLLAMPASWTFERTPFPRLIPEDQLPGDTPERIRVLAAIEERYLSFAPPPGLADRWLQVERVLPHRMCSLREVHLHEPWEWMPRHWRRLFTALQMQGIPFHSPPLTSPAIASDDSDLYHVQVALNRHDFRVKRTAKGDGSLVVLRFDREREAAQWMAEVVRMNPEFRPVVLLPDKNRILDNAFYRAGVPCMGLLSASTARPSLQILRLAPVFLWDPLDPAKVLEFVSLSIKPLDHRLGKRISEIISATPGTGGSYWRQQIAAFFDELATEGMAPEEIAGIHSEFRFWWERKRYAPGEEVPVPDVVDVFTHIRQWALRQSTGHSDHKSLQSLIEPCDQLIEWLSILPANETAISALTLERLIRTVLKPVPAMYLPRQQGALDFIYQPASLLHEVNELVWWNFVEMDPLFLYAKWYPDEHSWMEKYDIAVITPEEANRLQVWQRMQPLVLTKARLFLIVPAQIDGEMTSSHPLQSILETIFENPKAIEFIPGNEIGQSRWNTLFRMPAITEIPYQPIEKAGPFIHLPEHHSIPDREYETFTSVERLIYFPYQWVFQYFMKLKTSPILRIIDEYTLYGNLSHRIFERLLLHSFADWDKFTLEKWIALEGQRVIEEEGAPLLLYGMEPERIAFLQTVKKAAWSLISAIRENGWEVYAVEQELTGSLSEMDIRAKADLVLKRADEFAILDLKWGNETLRTNLIRNEEDIQLVMYARFMPPEENWAHTGYFIIKKGRLLVRNNAAFSDVSALRKEADHREINHRIWEKMQNTWNWRKEQLRRGMIEVRTTATISELEKIYENQLWDLLEMKKDNAAYDDYSVLLGMIQ